MQSYITGLYGSMYDIAIVISRKEKWREARDKSWEFVSLCHTNIY